MNMKLPIQIMKVKITSFNCGGFNPQKGLNSIKFFKIKQIQAIARNVVD